MPSLTTTSAVDAFLDADTQAGMRDALDLSSYSTATAAAQATADAAAPKLLAFSSTKTASHTLGLSDANKIVPMNVAGANNFTVPLNSAVAFPVGTQIAGVQLGAGTTTIAPTGGVTIRSRGGRLASAGQYANWALVKIATDEWLIAGDLV